MRGTFFFPDNPSFDPFELLCLLCLGLLNNNLNHVPRMYTRSLFSIPMVRGGEGRWTAAAG